MILRADRTVQTAQGQAVSGALVYVLLQPADTDALTPLAPLYSDSLGTVAENPAETDGLGQVALYLDNSQIYTFVVESPQIGTQVYPDQNLGNSPAAVTTFGQVPGGVIDGVNRDFTLTVTPALLVLQHNLGTLVPGVGYTFLNGVLSLAVAPQPGDTLYASGIVAAVGIFGEVPAGTIDGINRVFTLSGAPLLLFLQQNLGTLAPAVGYTLAGTVLTLMAAPQIGDTLYASGIR